MQKQLVKRSFFSSLTFKQIMSLHLVLLGSSHSVWANEPTVYQSSGAETTFSSVVTSVSFSAPIIHALPTETAQVSVNDPLSNNQLSTADLSAGNHSSVSLDQGNLLKIQLDSATLHTVLENTGNVVSDGSSVILSSTATSVVNSSIVNNSGIIEANAITNHNGELQLTGNTVTINGNLNLNTGDNLSIDHGSITINHGGLNITDNNGNNGSTLSVNGGNHLIQPTGGSITESAGSVQLVIANGVIQLSETKPKPTSTSLESQHSNLPSAGTIVNSSDNSQTASDNSVLTIENNGINTTINQ